MNEKRRRPARGGSRRPHSGGNKSSQGSNRGSSHGVSQGGQRSFSKVRGGSSRSAGGSHTGRGRSRGRSFGGNRGSQGGGRGRGGSRGRGKQMPINIEAFIEKSRREAKSHARQESEIFNPNHRFVDFGLDAPLVKAIEVRGYEHPTPIQDMVIPHIIKGEDIVGLANTGSGKTGAFLIPLIQKILIKKNEQVLILAPTRELAMQIEEEFRLFARTLGLFSVVCVGGMNIQPQIKKLRNHNHFIIGTPGRVMDLMKRGNLKLSGVHNVVLDEADRMLDMGFINDMRFILEKVPTDRQTLFFSATMSKDIERLLHDFAKRPVTLSVKTQDTSANVDQHVVKIGDHNKVDLLHTTLSDPEMYKVLVFGRTKHGVEKLKKILSKRGVKAESIHGNKSHNQRQRALKRFKDNQAQVLIATDVAARGLDIDRITHVINYDIPGSYDDYVHRIGRTGRAKEQGVALTFVA